MATGAIVKHHDILKDGGLGLRAGLKHGCSTFAFESGPKTLHTFGDFVGRIVPTLAGAAHAHLNLLLSEISLIALAGVLATAITMMKQAGVGQPD